MTIFELLDALEEGFNHLRPASQHMNGVSQTVHEHETDADVPWTDAVAQTQSLSADELRLRLDSADLSHGEFAKIFEVRIGTLQNWLSGKTKVPGWVGPSLRVVEQLSPSARQRLTRRRIEMPEPSDTLFPLPNSRPSNPVSTSNKANKKHPFSRIEEL